MQNFSEQESTRFRGLKNMMGSRRFSIAPFRSTRGSTAASTVRSGASTVRGSNRLFDRSQSDEKIKSLQQMIYFTNILFTGHWCNQFSLL